MNHIPMNRNSALRIATGVCAATLLALTPSLTTAQTTDFAGLDAAIKALREKYVDASEWAHEQVESAAIVGVLESLGTGARVRTAGGTGGDGGIAGSGSGSVGVLS